MAKEKDNLTVDTLDETLKQIQKLYGKGSIMRLGDRESVDVDAIPSGSLLLDEALGLRTLSRRRSPKFPMQLSRRAAPLCPAMLSAPQIDSDASFRLHAA